MSSDSNNKKSDERTFLHDLATPLGTASLLADSLLGDVQNRPDSDPDDLMRLSKICQALEKMAVLIKKRREILTAKEVPNARS